MKTRGPPEGKFTFTSHDAGDHSICLGTNYTGGWFSSRHIRMYLDINVGAAKHDVEQDRAHVGDVAQKLRDLNNRLEDIRREQQFQREREAQFRDLSESTNSRAAWYTVLQILVLFGTCVWQMRHLTVSPPYRRLPCRHSLITFLSSDSLRIGRSDEHSYLACPSTSCNARFLPLDLRALIPFQDNLLSVTTFTQRLQSTVYALRHLGIVALQGEDLVIRFSQLPKVLSDSLE